MKIKILKKLCLDYLMKKEENNKAMFNYYKRTTGKNYWSFTKSKYGKITDPRMEKARNKLFKSINFSGCDISPEELILKVIGVLE